MDVRISYGINIDKVPRKVYELLNNASEDVSKLLEALDVILQLVDMGNDNAPMAVELLDQLRIKMASIDRVVNDSQSILSGYVSATAEVSKSEQPSQVASPDTTPPSVPTEVRNAD